MLEIVKEKGRGANSMEKKVSEFFEIAVEKIQKIDKQFRGEELLADVNEALGEVKRNLYWVGVRNIKI